MTTQDSNQIQAILARLDTWFAKHRRRFRAGLNPGAGAAELVTLEKQLGMPLPADLRQLLAWHNGQSEDMVGKFEQDWQLMGTSAIADAKKELGSQAAQTGWQKSWLPFLDNDAGDYLCLDTSSAAAPVREFWLGEKEHKVVAPSLAAWLADFATAVEQGKYREESERGTFTRG